MPSNPEVDAWLAKYDSPMKPVIERVREIILSTDPRMEECIKGQQPTFSFAGDLASFNPRSKQASLTFHSGAEIPGNHPRLQGSGGSARYITLGSVREAEEARPELQALVSAWITHKGGGKKPMGKGAGKADVKKAPGGGAPKAKPADKAGAKVKTLEKAGAKAKVVERPAGKLKAVEKPTAKVKAVEKPAAAPAKATGKGKQGKPPTPSSVSSTTTKAQQGKPGTPKKGVEERPAAAPKKVAGKRK